MNGYQPHPHGRYIVGTLKGAYDVVLPSRCLQHDAVKAYAPDRNHLFIALFRSARLRLAW